MRASMMSTSRANTDPPGPPIGPSDVKLCHWLGGLCPVLQGPGRGSHQTCSLCQKCFISWSDLKYHITLHHVFFSRPIGSSNRPHVKWCPSACGCWSQLDCWSQLHKELTFYNHCHICGERALSRGRHSLARTNPNKGYIRWFCWLKGPPWVENWVHRLRSPISCSIKFPRAVGKSSG